MTNTTSTDQNPIADALAEVQSINQAVDRPAPKRKAPAKKAARKAAAKKSAAPKAKKNAEPKAPRVTKQQQMIELLSRPEGASNQELQEAFGIQPHSVRGAISTLKSKRGLTVNYESGRYSIPSVPVE